MASDERESKTEVLTAQTARGRTVPSVVLVVADAEGTGASVRCVDDPVRIGTSEVNELRLLDRSVSRVHAVVRRCGTRFVIEDLGSTNGTFVQGVRVRDADIVPGVRVQVGKVGIDVVASEPGTPQALPDRKYFGPLVGGSPAMRRIYATIEKAAPTNATVLILGETGTGKEVVARAVHEASSRSRGPFVAVDCGALTESLIESELFGHQRGAFTGAVSGRSGAFQAAHGGTLFFDEVGEMPAALQRRFLRVLETREVRAVGSDKARPVDVRIVAATNRHLAKAVNEGWFREDLYYRLAVVSVEVPPLRERRDDIPLLATHFLERFGGGRTSFPPSVLMSLMTREWPGNVRELRNYVERSAALGWEAAGETSIPVQEPAVDLGNMPLDLPLKEARDLWVERFERTYLERVLDQCGGNVTRAAEKAGVSRRFLQRTMARLKGG